MGGRNNLVFCRPNGEPCKSYPFNWRFFKMTSGRARGEPGVVVGDPVAEAQVRGGEITEQFVIADLIRSPGMSPDAITDLILKLNSHARWLQTGRINDATDAARIFSNRLRRYERLEPDHRKLLKYADAIIIQMIPHGG